MQTSDQRVMELAGIHLPALVPALEADAKNLPLCIEWMSEDLRLLPALNRAAEIYQSALRLFSRGNSRVMEPIISEISHLSPSSYELHRMIKDPQCSMTEAERERALHLVAKVDVSALRSMLIPRLGILYIQSITDLLRFRVTQPLSNVRMQCEAVALIRAAGWNDELAIAWRNAQTDEDGREFYNRFHQKEIKPWVKKLKLGFSYDSSSNVAMHCRFSGVSLGLDVSASDGDVNIAVSAQEFKPDRPETFQLIVYHIARVQSLIFSALSDLREMDDELFRSNVVPGFHREVAALFFEFERRNPQRVAEYMKQAAKDSGSLPPPPDHS